MCEKCHLDSLLLEEIVCNSLRVHGTGFHHGSLGVSKETREDLIRFGIEQYLEKINHGQIVRMGKDYGH